MIRIGDGIEHRNNHSTVRVEPWGPHAARVRVARRRVNCGASGALDLDPPLASSEVATTGDGGATLVNGELTVVVSAVGALRFVESATGRELLTEAPPSYRIPAGGRHLVAIGDGVFQFQQRFDGRPGERFFGLGQHQHGRLDQRGLVIDLMQVNTEVAVPFLVSSHGYGFLWNTPAIGRVELLDDVTTWVADATSEIDYWVVAAPTPAETLRRYADVTGHAPAFPRWASGLWQSRLRYRNQDELLAVATEYRRLGIPLSVLVIDYFHWTSLGEWAFEPTEWPDPRAMVAELADGGTEVMVSVWPTVHPLSANFSELRDDGLLVAVDGDEPWVSAFPDRTTNGAAVGVALYDATNPDARRFVWDRVRASYHDLGIRGFWLDACEPEIRVDVAPRLVYAAGASRAVASLYPREHVRGFYEHLRAAGEDEPLMLVRSAWAGCQRFGAALWSGDIDPTWEAFNAQVRAGLNVAISGLPWWTTDIGGFHGGDPDDPAYRELLIRWFEWSVFCPILRLHGVRADSAGCGPTAADPFGSGGPNELWSFGDEATAILTAQVRLREQLRPYLHEVMATASATGLPALRAMFLEFPDDPMAWEIDDAYLFGPTLLVAPVLAHGARERAVYLPVGDDWIDITDGAVHAGGQIVTLPAPLERIPVLRRADLPPAW